MQIKIPERIVPFIPYALLFIAPCIVYWPLWLHPEAMAYDMADYFLPCRYFIGECLQQHHFPWWNPYSGLGVPIAADPQSGVFYPVTWFIGYLFGYDFLTINLEYLLHLVIAGWSMFVLLRGLKYAMIVCLLLACCYQFSGFFVNNAQHLSWIISAAWLPLFFHYYRRSVLCGNWSDAIKTALSLFMITTGGYPAFLIILLYLIGGQFLFSLIRNIMQKNKVAILKMLKWSAIIILVYLIVTAPYILSFLQGVPLMTRGEALTKDHTLFRAFTPQSAVTFLLPAAPLGQSVEFNTDTSMANAYIGLFTLVFFIVGIVRSKTTTMRTILLLSFLFLLIAFGDALPLWPLLFDYIPFFDHIRFPAGFRLFVIIGFILIAAEGMKKEQLLPSKLPVIISFSMLLLLIIFSIASSFIQKELLLPVKFSTEAMLKFFGESSTANNMVLQSIIQILLLIGLVLLLLSKERWHSVRWYFLLCLMAFADLFIASRINFTVIMSSPFSAIELNKKLMETTSGFPMWDAEAETTVTNIGNGSFAPSYFNNNLFVKKFSRDSYIPFVLKLRSELEKSPDKFALMDHPVIFLTNAVQSYADSAAENVKLKTIHSILVPDSIAGQFVETVNDSLTSTIQLEAFKTNRFRVAVSSNQKAVLLLQQNYYPGWKVAVDGAIVAPFISNFCMMSVLLNAGKHKVDFYYDIKVLQWIWIASTCMLIFFIVFLFFNQMKINHINTLNLRP